MRNLVKPLNAAGVSMIELLIILTVLGSMIGVTTGIVLKVVRTQVRNNFLNQVVFTRDTFTGALQDNRIWQATVNAAGNTELACLKEIRPCTTRPTTFTPYETDGTPILGYDPKANPAAGFDRLGNVCDKFNPSTPDKECVYRLEFTATPTSATTNPAVEIKVDILFAVDETTSLAPNPNPDNYELPPFTRAGTPNIISGQRCPDKQVLTGFRPDGTIICTAASAFSPTAVGTGAPCTCPKSGCTCSKAGVCSCPGRCGKRCS